MRDLDELIGSTVWVVASKIPGRIFKGELVSVGEEVYESTGRVWVGVKFKRGDEASYCVCLGRNLFTNEAEALACVEAQRAAEIRELEERIEGIRYRVTDIRE